MSKIEKSQKFVALIFMGYLLLLFLVGCSFNDNNSSKKDKEEKQEKSSEIEVILNGQMIDMKSPVVISEVLFANPETLLKILKIDYEWNREEQTLAIYYGDFGLAYQADNINANLNNEAYKLEAEPYEKGGKLWIPLETLEDIIPCSIDWNERKNTVKIQTENETPKQQENEITGLWSTSASSSGLIVDEAGVPIDYTYSGFWYRFDQEGTYLQVAVGSGLLIKGGVVVNGHYEIRGNKIYLTDNLVSFYPAPGEKKEAYEDKPSEDVILEFSIDPADGTLTLIDLDTGIDEQYYRID